jgi:hypothetical protein
MKDAAERQYYMYRGLMSLPTSSIWAPFLAYAWSVNLQYEWFEFHVTVEGIALPDFSLPLSIPF